MENKIHIDIYVTYNNIIYRHILKNHEAFLQLNSSAETKTLGPHTTGISPLDSLG